MNPIELEIHRHRFQAIAEEMGIVLRNTARSANIKERLDFSCALTDRDGLMVAQAAHIPVHLGSCHLTARHLLAELELEDGDVVMVNDPFRGGTHLPDVTLFRPVFLGGERRASFGVIARAHHADVGGGVPGSMGDFEEIFQEGLIIPPVKIVARGRLVRDVEALFLANVRTPAERRGDLAAQLAAVERGALRLAESAARHGAARLRRAGRALMDAAERGMRALIAAIPDGEHRFVDHLDGADSPAIAVRVVVRGDDIVLDFAGCSPVLRSSLNAHEAITLSAAFYALRCLGDEEIPSNSGILRPLDLRLPLDSVVSARHPAPVAAGNVETSQRIVDAIFGALAQALPGRIPAASQGSMNNVSFGGRRGDGEPFTYFETLAGGIGAGPLGPGASGLHSHMTNTRNTPIEAFEADFPLRIRSYCLRATSGGAGRHPGGEGVVREYEALAPLSASILSTRRELGPWGLAGGGPARPGRNFLIRDGRRRALPASVRIELQPGDRLRIETPGGGGWGASD
ncbi:MAG: hydantoinase B/oxoprolinase family protein [Planctomycetes bacterium]|nr:hydantoinase B/oxoprolinase family protein [Planctomycetota bacterium]